MSTQAPAVLPAEPRSEVGQRRRRPRRGVVARWLGELKLLGERGGAALGDAYALAASSVLNELERLEDLNAERRFRQRLQARAASRAAVARGLTVGKEPPSISKVST
jgi:hypothetical protein